MSADQFINALATLFVIVDPVSLPPIFLSLTTGMDASQRRRVAVQAVVIAFVVLAGFALVGRELLALLGISLAAFRIAGGLFLFWTAFEMVFERRQQRKSAAADTLADDSAHVAAFPLAMPLIAGPGAITAVMLLAGRSGGEALALAGLIGTIAVVLAACLLTALLAGPLERLLGRTGRIVVTRLLGVVLAALAVQFVADGVRELMMS